MPGDGDLRFAAKTLPSLESIGRLNHASLFECPTTFRRVVYRIMLRSSSKRPESVAGRCQGLDGQEPGFARQALPSLALASRAFAARERDRRANWARA